MNLTKLEKAQAQLDSHFLTFSTVTTLDLKNELIANWPEENWSQQWVSGFMQDQDLNYVQDSTRRFRIYEAPVILTIKDVEAAVLALETSGANITKNNVKRILRGANLPLWNFKDLFDQLGLQHVKNNYTADNHKIWTRVPTGKHLSQSKGKLVDIESMPKKYLQNAICKYVADYAGFDMHTVLTNPNMEMHKLLKAYFTYDLREVLKNI